MSRVTGQIVAAVGCTAVALVPWAVDGRPNPYAVIAGTLLAGLLLGLRAIALVFAVCIAIAAFVFVAIQVDPQHNYDNGGDGRWLFVYFSLTAFPLVASAVAATGALARWLVLRALGRGAPLTSPRLQASLGWAALAALVAAVSWSSESLVFLLGLPVIAWFALRRRPERPSAQ